MLYAPTETEFAPL